MPGIVTVDELTGYITMLFERNELLSFLQVRGELADLKRHTSGHVYFSLTGKDSRVSCVLFRSDAGKIPRWPQNGDEVLVEGRAGIYGPRGAYQIYGRNIRPLGEGAQARAKKELFQRLSLEGLFDPARKRSFPEYPLKVAVVTSSSGAAVRDVLKVSLGRFPRCEVVVVPVTVQGACSTAEITGGLARAGRIPGVEAVMLVRGGGSREDLNPFDEEEVVRAVRNCPLPVITGLGHQTDRTLADLAADLDAPTPSAAAETLFPSVRHVLGKIEGYRDLIMAMVGSSLRRRTDILERRGAAMAKALERSTLAPWASMVERLFEKMAAATAKELAASTYMLENTAASLDALSPLRVLSRGYASCLGPDGKLLSSALSVSPGDGFTVRFRDGSVVAEVKDAMPLG
ncbi:MAG TPA: exodeoxyribonuclease VII large subunit [Synergistetes bacterium]|nr:exodeoxyribonuclease VII large subunit [Synergistota bacterium]